MANYKLHITLDIGDVSCSEDTVEDAVKIAVSRAKMFLQDTCLAIDGQIRYDGIPINVSLTRENDKSGANLLAPVPGTKHYKHTKVPITDVIT